MKQWHFLSGLMLLCIWSMPHGYAQSLNLQQFRAAAPYQILPQTYGTKALEVPLAFSVYANYVDQPLEFTDNDGQENIIDGILAYDLNLSALISKKITFNIATTFAPLMTANGALSDLISERAMGDTVTTTSFTLKDRNMGGLGAALLQEFYIPTGSQNNFFGDQGLGAGVSVALDYKKNRWYGALNVGWVGRLEEAQLANVSVQNQWVLNAGLAYEIGAYQLATELMLKTDQNDPFGSEVETPVEGLVSATTNITEQAKLTGGIGAGLTDGYGTGAWRMVLGLSFVPKAKQAKPTNQEEVATAQVVQVTQVVEGDQQMDFADQHIHFEKNQFYLIPESVFLLQRYGAYLRNHPEKSVVLKGYTDTNGDEEYNKELSKKRAQRVKRFLVTGGVSPDRIEVSPQGESNMALTDDVYYNDLLNRRVEIHFVN